ncbi:MAG TPA: hypothetical protein VFG89_00210, partial [Coriobacteriia bacterium]|nr:hypothetical protein [Coriobacteriia bacterium]
PPERPATAVEPPEPALPAEPVQKKRSTPMVIAVVAVLALCLVGAAVAGTIWSQRSKPKAASADPGSLGFDEKPFDYASSALASQTAAATPVPVPETTAAPAPEATAAPAPAPAALTPELATTTVTTMLQHMHDGKQADASALATPRMLATVGNDLTWFAPGPDVLISWEVKSAADEGGVMKVHLVEQWNSGSEKTAYSVILEGAQGKVDNIEWLNQ